MLRLPPVSDHQRPVVEKPLLGPNLNPSTSKTLWSSGLPPSHTVPVMCAPPTLRELAGMTLGNHLGAALFYRKSRPERLVSCLESHSKLTDRMERVPGGRRARHFPYPPGRLGEVPVAPRSTLGPGVTLQVSALGRCRSTGGTRGQKARGEGRSSRRGKPVHPDRMHRHAGAPGPTSCQRGHPSPPWGRNLARAGAGWRKKATLLCALPAK